MGQSAISEQQAPHPSLKAESVSGYESAITTTADSQNSLDLLVSGVHCAGCIQKIESRLTREADVKNARINFSTRRLNIVWTGDKIRANDFVGIVQSLGYGVDPYNPDREKETADNEERFLLLCLGVAGFATGNIMLLSVSLWTSTIETMGMDTRDFFHLVSGLIAIPAMLFSGRPFFRSAIRALSSGHTNMDVPISVGVTLTAGMSLLQAFRHAEHAYFDAGVMLLFFLLIGRYLDFRARRNARSSATNLLSTFAGFATVVEGAATRKVLIRDLKEDMMIRIAAGEKFPVDAIVVEGESEVDTSLVTGETVPRAIRAGQDVYAGTLNISAPVTVCVAKAAENSLLADIVRLMEKAGQSQAHYVRIADRAARLYTPVVHALAAISFLGWWIGMNAPWDSALMIATTVLIITCPCAMGLAVPVVQVLATSRLMKSGILVKAGDALERLAGIDTILLDKTGTLTLGHPTLKGSMAGQDALHMAASLAASSRHPLSRAISQSYNGEILPLTDIQEHAGQGLSGKYQGTTIRLGSRNWCGDDQVPVSDDLELWLAIDGKKPVPFYFADTLRPDAARVVSAMQAAGLNIIILSGDRAQVVTNMAKELNITTYYAEQTPPMKFAILDDLKLKGHRVLMVGDGLNDAPVLAGANVSMAPGTAIDMAQNAADIVFMGDSLAPVFTAIKTATLSQKLVKQNFIISVVYNVIAIPIAVCGYVTPMIAAIAMSGSSLIVIANSFRLRILKG